MTVMRNSLAKHNYETNKTFYKEYLNLYILPFKDFYLSLATLYFYTRLFWIFFMMSNTRRTKIIFIFYEN
jgi:hypothetical protein